ncbi:SGNH/GDSL hydrolase family protein [bacterium]|nr:SGNH/GDSL hydrolase family protein [bacterium]
MINRSSRKSAHWLAVILVLAVCTVATLRANGEGGKQASRADTYRVLLVGDSWAEHLWNAESLRTVFAENGYTGILEKGDKTAIGGTTASEWQTEPFLLMIDDELDENPSIDIVHISLGGNDLLAGQAGNGWSADLSDEDEQALFDRIVGDIDTVVDRALDARPDVQVLLTAYDYPNFEDSLDGSEYSCWLIWLNAGHPTTLELNNALIGLEAEITAYAATKDRVTFVSTLGLMQYWYGYPSQNIDPFTITPPGDPSLPTPPEAMDSDGDDCIHISDQGYYYMALNCFDKFYKDALGPRPAAPAGFLVY